MAEEFSKVIKKKSIFAQLGSVNYMSARSSEWGPNTTPEGFTQNMNESKLVSYTSPDDEMIVTTTSLLDNVKNFSRHIIIGPGQDIFSNVAAVGFITRKSLPGRYSIQRKSDYRYITSNNTYTYPPLLRSLLPPPLNRIDEIGNYDGTTSLIKQPREYIENLQEQKKTGVNFFSNWSSDGFSTYRSPLGKYGIQYISDFKGISLLTKTFIYPNSYDVSLPYTFQFLKWVGNYYVDFFSGIQGKWGSSGRYPAGFTIKMKSSQLVVDDKLSLPTSMHSIDFPVRLTLYNNQKYGQNLFENAFANGFVVNKGNVNGSTGKYFINTESDFISLGKRGYFYPDYIYGLPYQFRYIYQLSKFDEIRDEYFAKSSGTIKWEDILFDPFKSSAFRLVSNRRLDLASYYSLASRSDSLLGYRHNASDKKFIVPFFNVEPFYIKEIPTSKDSTLSNLNDAEKFFGGVAGLINSVLPLRGTLSEVLKSTYEDSIRLTNLFVSPRGIKFFANQTLLHLLSPRKETGLGPWIKALPANLLQSALGSQIGFHVYRHSSTLGIFGGGLTYLESDEVIKDEFNENLNDLDKDSNNRLVNYYKKNIITGKSFGEFSLFSPKKIGINLAKVFSGDDPFSSLIIKAVNTNINTKPREYEKSKIKNHPNQILYKFRSHKDLYNMKDSSNDYAYNKLLKVKNDDNYTSLDLSVRYYNRSLTANIIQHITSRSNDLAHITFNTYPNGDSVQFRAIIDNISDTYSPSYTNINYLGNPITYPLYQNMKRTISISFKVPIYFDGEADKIIDRLKTLSNYTYPLGRSTKIKTPFIKMKFPNIDVLGVITSLSYSIDSSIPYLGTSVNGKFTPLYPSVTSVSLTMDVIPEGAIPSNN